MKCPDTTNNFTIPGTMFMLVLVEASREADTRQMMDSSCLAGWCIGVSGIGVSCMHIGSRAQGMHTYSIIRPLPTSTIAFKIVHCTNLSLPKCTILKMCTILRAWYKGTLHSPVFCRNWVELYLNLTQKL